MVLASDRNIILEVIGWLPRNTLLQMGVIELGTQHQHLPEDESRLIKDFL